MKTTSTLLLPLALGATALTVATPVMSIEPRTSINSILALISTSISSSTVYTTSSGITNAVSKVVATLGGIQTTHNDVKDGECGHVTLIFARGTGEPGNVGSLVGPEFYSALETAVGSASVVFQGVNDYDASIDGYLEGGSTEGATNMASLVTEAFSQCPDTQVVLSGYSQGAQVVHLAAADLPAATMEKVSAVVTFGDPDSTSAVANIDSDKVLVICHVGDDICQFGDVILLPHLTYAENASAAAAWVVERLDL